MLNQIKGLFGEHVCMGISQRGIALLRRSAKRKVTILGEMPFTETQDWDCVRAQCHDLLKGANCAGLPLVVTVSDECVRFFMVPPPQHASSIGDLQAAMFRRFEVLYGEPPQEWRLTANWHVTDTFPACALPSVLSQQIEQLATENELHLVSVVPKFFVFWNRYHRVVRPGAWLLLVQDNSISLGITSVSAKGSLIGIHSLPLSSSASGSPWLAQQIARLALRQNVACPEYVQWNSDFPLSWLMEAPPTTLPMQFVSIKKSNGSKEYTSTFVSRSVSPTIMLAACGIAP